MILKSPSKLPRLPDYQISLPPCIELYLPSIPQRSTATTINIQRTHLIQYWSERNKSVTGACAFFLDNNTGDSLNIRVSVCFCCLQTSGTRGKGEGVMKTESESIWFLLVIEAESGVPAVAKSQLDTWVVSLACTYTHTQIHRHTIIGKYTNRHTLTTAHFGNQLKGQNGPRLCEGGHTVEVWGPDVRRQVGPTDLLASDPVDVQRCDTSRWRNRSQGDSLACWIFSSRLCEFWEEVCMRVWSF